ncbi:RNA polymerase sigma factor [Sphingobacterium sp. UT-1RO-CII-1]|uniref:RNA polymerase sigma factor n=1 Tax=Sphingobacterium sp. UT-1RO-CII-1 TaxID=2995225 RepID=UPI00227BD8FA|nr:RNA polymerase sigma factor [Sphingobacterium sp. UT-1RO-CII-1]MCY4779011.1 RNA polymerase sigma factor [Sphingobacterium sp. UT-1RO-CII-1]
MKIIKQYWGRKDSLSLRKALESCPIEGDERGQSFVYKRYYGYLMAIALRYTNEQMEAEEVVNESFIKCFRRLSTFVMNADDEILDKTFKAWLARITVNTAIDALRAKKSVDFFDDISAEELKTHSVMISDSLEVEDILKLLNRIPEIQRSIFNMFEIEGYSHEEIAEKLNIPESTSRTYLTRAKQRLRKLYQEEIDVLQNSKILKGG